MFPRIDLFGRPADVYTLCFLTGFVIVFIAVLAFKPREFPMRRVFWGVVIFFIFAFIGANLLNIISHASQHKGHTVKQIFLDSGLSYLGAPLLGFFALWIYLKLAKIPFLTAADYVAPFLMLERFIGRIGCLAYGCCYGIPSDLPWAYPFNSWGITSVVPRHPAQAYELIYSLAILISSCYLYKRVKSANAMPMPEGSEVGSGGEIIRQAPSDGVIFFYAVFWYSSLRFCNEFLRAEGPFLCGPFKTVHIALAVFAAASAAGIYFIIRSSIEKEEILNSLKAASIRLAAWLAGIAVIVLTAISAVFNPPSRNFPPVRAGMDSEGSFASADFRRSGKTDSAGVSPRSFNSG